MNKDLLVLVALCLLGGSLYWNWQQTATINQQQSTIDQQQRKIEELVSETASVPPPGRTSEDARADVDLQEKCAAAAQKRFVDRSLKDNPFASFTNHFNKGLGKCFVEIQLVFNPKGDLGHVTNSKDMSDAYEGKEYADYHWYGETGKNYGQGPPSICWMMPDGDEASRRNCKNEAEFDAFVSMYMKDAQ